MGCASEREEPVSIGVGIEAQRLNCADSRASEPGRDIAFQRATVFRRSAIFMVALTS